MTPAALFRVLGFRHTLPALHAMLLGPRRFVELERELKLPGLPLIRTLRQLQKAGLVMRLESGPSQAIYGLTPRARQVLKLCDLFDDFEEAVRVEQANPFWEMTPSQRENHRRVLEATK